MNDHEKHNHPDDTIIPSRAFSSNETYENNENEQVLDGMQAKQKTVYRRKQKIRLEKAGKRNEWNERKWEKMPPNDSTIKWLR